MEAFHQIQDRKEWAIVVDKKAMSHPSLLRTVDRERLIEHKHNLNYPSIILGNVHKC